VAEAAVIEANVLSAMKTAVLSLLIEAIILQLMMLERWDDT
jgi:hypothetical protein